MSMEEKNILRLRCCMLDLDGSMHDDDFKLINWDMPAESGHSTSPRIMLQDEISRLFGDMKWPFKTSIRGELFVYFFNWFYHDVNINFNLYHNRQGRWTGANKLW